MGGSILGSASAGRSSNPSPQTPITTSSRFSLHDEEENINVNDDKEENINVNDDKIKVGHQEKFRALWKWNEDEILINGWLNVSKDPIIGTDQKGNAFWTRMHEYCKEANPCIAKRTTCALKKRWFRINSGVGKFARCFAKVRRRKMSGASIEDEMEFACQMYQNECGHKFVFIPHWKVLQKEEKWKAQETSSGSVKRTKNNASGAYTSSSNNETPIPEDVSVQSPIHPRVNEAAKQKNKGKSKAESARDVLKEELDAIKTSTCRSLALFEEWKNDFKTVKEQEIEQKQTLIEQKRLEIEQKRMEMEQKQMEIDMKIIYADTSTMSQEQLKIHYKLLAKIEPKYM